MLSFLLNTKVQNLIFLAIGFVAGAKTTKYVIEQEECVEIYYKETVYPYNKRIITRLTKAEYESLRRNMTEG